jgi:cytochrome c5
MERFLLLGAALLWGCSEPSNDSTTSAQPGSNSAPVIEEQIAPLVSEAAMAQWARSCVLCHVNGEGGAPRVGHPDEWVARVAQGETVLLNHTLEGYNNMPPLGYCMDCEAEDFNALIRFMAEGS